MSLPIVLSGVAGSRDRSNEFLWTTNLLYRFDASAGVFSDDAGTPAVNNDTVQVWENLGSAEDAVQNTSARRPTYKTGGINGRPYLDCNNTTQQFFQDLAFSQPSGLTTLSPFTVFVVTDAVGNLSQTPAILGSTVSTGGKVRFYFGATSGQQVTWIKEQIKVGNVANPQVMMGTNGRNAEGTTSATGSRLWLRQNRSGLWEEVSQASNLSSTAISTTQFLRNTGLTSGGYFHGHLYEFLLYAGTLDNATTFAIEDFLSARYGIA
jgi:hypothetical protein